MIMFLTVCLAVFQGGASVRGVFSLFARHWRFWIAAGSIGFGGFYALICFSADHAPGWVVATTWQCTIMASLVVLCGFGRSFPKKTWGLSFISFLGVLLVNASAIGAVSFRDIMLGTVPVLLAAFCYPIGNQMVWEAANGNPRLPDIRSPYLENPFNKVLLLSLGSVPFWCLLVGSFAPAPPSRAQLINTALVALSSGVVATSLFLYARNKAAKASELAAVDATQSSEVVFAVIGEVLFLGAPLPNAFAFCGMFLVFTGLVLFIRFQERQVPAST